MTVLPLVRNVTSGRVMADSHEHLIDLLKNLLQHDVRFIVCGGVAAVLHGVERLTVDLDISLDRSNENIHNFLAVMKSEEMIPRAPAPAESLFDEELLQRFVQEKDALVFTFHDPYRPFRQIDLFITRETSYDRLITATQEIRIDTAYTLNVLSVTKLLEMKEAVNPKREKDHLDIIMLKRLMEQ